MKIKLKEYLKYFLIVIIAVLFGFIAIEVAYCIPTERICQNVIDSDKDLLDDPFFENGKYLKSYNYTNPDNYTNGLMLGEALIKGGSDLSTALLNPHASDEEYTMTPFVALKKAAYDILNDETINLGSYGRYWHGYLVLLKPLLFFFTYAQIIIINQIVIVLLICTFFFLLAKTFSAKVMIPATALLLVLNPFVISVSFQLSSIFHITIIAMIAVLILKEEYQPYIFLVSGILVAYFDFLTYPIVALGVPLILALLKNRNLRFSRNALFVIKQSVLFFVGYGVMWLGKWILASVLTDENIILDAINSIMYRTLEESSDFIIEFSYGNVLSSTMGMIPKSIIVIILGSTLIYMIYYFWKRKSILSELGLRLSVLVPALFPFVWYRILMNHSLIHPHLVFRDWAVFIFGIVVSITLPSIIKGEQKS